MLDNGDGSPSSQPQEESRLRKSLEGHLRAAAEQPGTVSPPSVSAEAPQVHSCQQSTLNMEVEAEVTSQSEGLNLWFESQCTVVQRIKEGLRSLCRDLDGAMNELERRYKWTKKETPCYDTFQEKVELHVPPLAVWKLVTDWPEPQPEHSVIRRALQGLLGPLDVGETEALKSELLPVKSVTEVHHMVPKVVELQEQLRWQRWQLENEETAEDGPNSPLKKRALSELFHKLENLDQQRLALEPSSTSMRDEIDIRSVVVLEDMLALLRDRLQRQTSAGDYTSREDLDIEADAALGAVASWEQDRGDLLERVMLDEEKVAKEKARAREEGLEMEEQHRERMAKLWQAMQENSEAQKVTFAGVTDRLEDLTKLCERRVKLVEEHTELVADYSRRRAEHAGWVALAEYHGTQLLQLSRHLDGVQFISGSFQEYFKLGFKTLAMGWRDAERRADEARKQTMVDYLATFRAFTLRAGELLHRKEQLRHSVDRTLRAEELLVLTAPHTSDPAIQDHRAAVKLLEDRKEHLQTFSVELRGKMEDEGGLFEPVRLGLEEICYEFVDPLQELEQVLVEKEGQILAQVRSHVEQELELAVSRSQDLRRRSVKSQLKRKEHETQAATRRQAGGSKKPSRETIGKLAGSPVRARTTGQVPPSTRSALGFEITPLSESLDPLPLPGGERAVRPHSAGTRRPPSDQKCALPRPQSASGSRRAR
eukprot:Hpha_TRINITY_DN17169_c0_g1::TRINITY_DN17169_c0_g1_i1::g.146658::m.146658